MPGNGRLLTRVGVQNDCSASLLPPCCTLWAARLSPGAWVHDLAVRDIRVCGRSASER